MGTRHHSKMDPGRVVLIMHGTFGTSFQFVGNGPDYALGEADFNY